MGSHQFNGLELLFSMDTGTTDCLAVHALGGDQLAVAAVGLKQPVHKVVADVVPDAAGLTELHRVRMASLWKRQKQVLREQINQDNNTLA
jgi:hypothetical protein